MHCLSSLIWSKWHQQVACQYKSFLDITLHCFVVVCWAVCTFPWLFNSGRFFLLQSATRHNILNKSPKTWSSQWLHPYTFPSCWCHKVHKLFCRQNYNWLVWLDPCNHCGQRFCDQNSPNFWTFAPSLLSIVSFSFNCFLVSWRVEGGMKIVLATSW